MATPNLEANAAYENACMVSQDLVGRIGELLKDLPSPDNDEHPIDWGHVGSVNHLNAKLSEIVAFIDGSN